MMSNTGGWMKMLQVDEDRKILGIQWNDRTEDIELIARGGVEYDSCKGRDLRGG